MAKNVVTLNLDNTDYSFRPYGVCETLSGVGTKTVSMSGFTLFPGATICVNFLHSNTAKHTATTLNINNTGNMPVVGSKLTNAGVYEFVYDGDSWNIIKSDNSKTFYSIDLSNLDSGKFYPVIMDALHYTNECEIHSPSLGGTEEFNQNMIHFLLTSDGYSDTPKSFKVLSYGLYTTNEITIGAVGYGNTAGEHCVWLRGGLKYDFFCTTKPILYTEGYSYSEQVFMPGTNYHGGENAKVTICWSADNPRSEVLSEPASSTKLGGIKTGYIQSDNKYPVQLDSNKNAYVNMTELGNQIQALAAGLTLNLTASLSTIYKNKSTPITLTATVKDTAGNVNATSIVIKDGSTELKSASNTYTTSVSKSISTNNNTYTFATTAVVNGMTLNKSVSISARNAVYYGMGNSAEDVKANGSPASARTSAVSNITYDATASSNGERFYLLVPSDVTRPTSFSMGGAPVDMVIPSSTTTIDGIAYYVFYTNATYNSGGNVQIKAQ